jgi:hypothetical protein
MGTVFLVSLSPVISSQDSSSQASVAPRATTVDAGPQGVSTAGYTVPSNLSYCGLLGPNPGSSSGLQGYEANVTVFWNELCVQPAFISLIDAWGGPFFLTWPDAGANLSYWASANLSTGSSGSSRALYANFEISWQPSYCYNNSAYRGNLPPCSWAEYWNGDVWTNELSGPHFVNWSCECASKGLPLPPSPGFPYGPVLGFSLVGACGVGVELLTRLRH